MADAMQNLADVAQLMLLGAAALGALVILVAAINR